MTFSTIAVVYCGLLAVGLPLLAARTGLRENQAAEVARARRAVYLSAAISICVLAGLTFGVAAWQDIAPRSLGWRVERPLTAFAWAAAVAVGGLLTVWLVARAGRFLGLRESPLSQLLMPQTAKETRDFLLLAAVAAVGEEYLYRGYVFNILTETLGSVWAAGAISAVSFGVAHGYQRTVGVARATLLGGLLTLPVAVTGSLFPAIVAHFWINAAIGLGGWKRFFPEHGDGLAELTETENPNRDWE